MARCCFSIVGARLPPFPSPSIYMHPTAAASCSALHLEATLGPPAGPIFTPNCKFKPPAAVML